MTHDNEQLIPVSEQAAHWWVVFRGADVSPAERREFAQWIVQSPERVGAYLRVARVQSALARPDLYWPQTPAEVLIRDSVASQNEPVPLRRRRLSQQGEATRRPTLRVAAVALAAALLVAVGLGWLSWSQPQQFQTKFGEQRSVLLADGSRVTLNTASKIEVLLRAHRRSVHLLRGEALFEVAHDSTRPFDVLAGNVVLRAVGTQFNVDRRVDTTVVTVVEGRVAIVGENSKYSGARLPILAAADRLVVDDDGLARVEHGVDVSAVTAWTQRQLVFEGRPLGEVVEEFNRYNLRHIEIRSPALWAKEVTGSFQSNDPASFVSFMESIPGVHVTDDGHAGYIVSLEELRAEKK